MFKIESILSASPDHDVRGECMLQPPADAHRLAARVAYISGGPDEYIWCRDTFACLLALTDEQHDGVALFHLVDIALADSTMRGCARLTLPVEQGRRDGVVLVHGCG